MLLEYWNSPVLFQVPVAPVLNIILEALGTVLSGGSNHTAARRTGVGGLATLNWSPFLYYLLSSEHTFRIFRTIYNMKVSTWEKKLPELVKDNNYKWIAKNHKKIYEYITQHYTNKNTLKEHISVLAGNLRALDTLPLVQKNYSKIATELCLELQDESKKQELLPQRKENFVFLQDIIKRREQFIQLFEQDKANNKNNLSWVLLSLYTMQPPIRMEYKDMEIVTVLPKNKKQNFIFHKNNKYSVVIRNDKVIKSHGPANFELPEELNNVISESLKAFPRKYILSTQRDGSKQIGKQGFESLLKHCFSPQRVTVDILRSAYITHFYSDPRKTLG